LGLTPRYAGLAQANIQVPNLATGDYPLVLTVGGYVSSSAVISVSGPGTAPSSFLTLLGQLPLVNSSSSTIAINNNTTYVCGANRIYIIDTSNVNTPKLLGEFGDADLAGVAQHLQDAQRVVDRLDRVRRLVLHSRILGELGGNHFYTAVTGHARIGDRRASRRWE